MQFDLAGSDLVQTLFNPPQVLLHSLFCEVRLQELRRAALLIKPFPYSHNISVLSASLSNTTQRDLVNFKAEIIKFIENLTRVPLKLEKPENRRLSQHLFSCLVPDLVICVMVAIVWK